MHHVQPRVQGVTPELMKLYRDIGAATIGHFTDLGFVRDLYPLFRPIRLLGNAVTVRIPPMDGGAIREALLLSQPEDVLVIDMSGDDHRACWGELRTRAALIKQLSGVVISGGVTDVRVVTELRFPVFSRSVSALTTRSRDLPGEVNTAVSVGGVCVQPGDLVVGDDDGLFVLSPWRARELGSLLTQKQREDELQRGRLVLPHRFE
jgi:4-hydroxy-4-methyl-2-oxoglutarate aldolase